LEPAEGDAHAGGPGSESFVDGLIDAGGFMEPVQGLGSRCSG